MNFLKIKEKLIKRKTIYYIFLFISIFLISGEFAFAELNKDTINHLNTVIDYINIFLALVSTILGVLTGFISWFLSPEWWNGKIFGLNDYFKDVWILVSNIAYTIFAIILIIIAFMNIIGGKGDNWELKQALPKFIVGVLIVPLSWFLIQFMLTISAVLTTSVMLLPYDIFSDRENEIFQGFESIEVPTTFIVKLGSTTENETDGCSGDSDANRVEGGIFVSCYKENVRSILMGEAPIKGDSDGSFSNSSLFGIINVYTYMLIRVDKEAQINSLDVGDSIKSIWDLIQKFAFDVIFVVIYVVLLIALFLALLVRGISVWIYTMFSPIFGLLYFFGKAKDGVGDGQMKFGLSSFIKLALVPVYVAGVFAFGMIFLFVVAHSVSEGSKTTTEGCLLSGGAFEFCIDGTIGDTDAQSQIDQLLPGLDSMGRLIVQIIGIVILWIGIMAALKSAEITGKVIAPIEDFGKQVGGLVMRSPMYAPIIPTGGGKYNSIGAVTSAGKQFVSTLKHLPESKGQKLFEEHNPFATGKSMDYGRLATKASTITNDIQAKNVGEEIKKVGTIEEFAREYRGREGLAKVYEKLVKEGKVANKKDLINKLRMTNSVSELKDIISKLEKGVEKQFKLFDGDGDGKITINEVSDGFGSKSSNNKENGTSQSDKSATVSIANQKVTFTTINNNGNQRAATIPKSTSKFTEGQGKDFAETVALSIADKTIKMDDLRAMRLEAKQEKELLKQVRQYLDKTDSGYSYNKDGDGNLKDNKTIEFDELIEGEENKKQTE